MTRRRARRFLVRVGAMAGKEVLHIRRDPRTLALALVMPVLLLLLFGFGVSFDLERIPLAVADRDRTPASRELVRRFLEPGEFRRAGDVDAAEVEDLFRERRAFAALVVPVGYGRDLARGAEAEAQLLVDGADAVTANQILAKADAIVRAASRERAERAGLGRSPPLQVKLWTRYNPEGRSAIFFVPGLAAYLLAMAAVLLTALAISGEWERGSMEQLFASPVGRLEILVGKLVPFAALGMLELLLVLAVGATVFEVPVRGNVLVVFLFGVFFLAGMLGQGLFISVVAKNQLVATQAGALSALLPSMLLSGMIFPIENMPLPLRLLSYAVPARYLVHALRGVLLKGAGLSTLWPDLLAQLGFSVAIVALATARFRRRVA